MKVQNHYREEGNVTLIVVAILLFMTTVGLGVLAMTSADLKTAYNSSWKAKSDGMVEFALEEYRERLNELLLQENAYYVSDVDLSLMNTDPFYINQGPSKEIDVEFFDVQFDSTTFETNYEYMNSLTSAGDTEGLVLYKNPPIDEDFETRDYADIVGSGSGILSVDAIHNEAYGANEFFISKTVFSTTTGLLQDIRLFQHFPLIEAGTQGELLVSTKEDLELAMGNIYDLSAVTLNDDVTISAAWDKNLNSPVVVMAVSVATEERVHLFTLTPLIDTEFQYYDTLQLADVLLKAEVKAAFDENVNSVVAVLSTLTELAPSNHMLSAYPFYFPLDDTIDVAQKVELVVPQTSRTLSTSLLWNETLRTSELFLFSAEDSLTAEGDISYGGKISIYNLNVGLDANFAKKDEIDLSLQGIDNIHTMGSDVHWDETLNDGFVDLFFSSPNKDTAQGQYRLFHLETSIFNFDKTEIKEMDTPALGIENIGRISAAGTTTDDFGELMVFLEKSFVRIEKVLLENAMPYNIIITAYEDNRSGRVGAKTKIAITPEIEITTVMDSNIRYVKSFTVKELVVD